MGEHHRQVDPVESLRQINRVLGHNFVTKYGTKQGVLVLGKQLPFGIGAAIGGAGNAAFAQFTIRSAKRAFGPPPEHWPSNLDLTDPDHVPLGQAAVAITASDHGSPATVSGSSARD